MCASRAELALVERRCVFIGAKHIISNGLRVIYSSYLKYRAQLVSAPHPIQVQVSNSIEFELQVLYMAFSETRGSLIRLS